MRNKYLKLSLVLAILFLSQVSFAATNLAPFPKFTALDSNGDPLSGGQLFTYIVSTTTKKTTYTTEAATTANANPVVLNSSGQADVWLTGCYTLVLWDSSDVVQWTVDEVCGLTIGEVTTGVTNQIAVYSGVSTVDGVNTISGNSVVGGTANSGVSGAALGSAGTIIGGTKIVSITSSVTPTSGTTTWLYGAYITNINATSSVTLTLGTDAYARSGMNFEVAADRGDQDVWVQFQNTGDEIFDSTSDFATGIGSGTSYYFLSGTTGETLAFIAIGVSSWRVVELSGTSETKSIE